MADQREQYLDLPDGRILAYDHAGNPNSKTIVIYYHGACTIGDASRPSPALLKHDIHYITPTLAGWGNTSPRNNPEKTPYYINLAQETIALLEHLHPGCSDAPIGEYKIYLSGGSFGTVPAQMIFNASEEVFPPARHIVTCLLLAPITPFKYHKDYAKDLTWDNYLTVGPISRIVPWKLFSRLGTWAFGLKLKNVKQAEVFLRSMIIDKMKEEEKLSFEKWRKERGLEEGQFERNMAEGMVKSVGKSWDGFMEMPDILHSDWGFKVEDMQKKPVFITTSEGDRLAPESWAKWLADNYPNAKLKRLAGGHIAGLWSLDSIWEEFLVAT